MQRVQHGPCVLRQSHEVAALDRLHDDDGLIMRHAHLIAPAALYRGVVIILIIELYLHGLDIRVIRQYLLKHLGPVVE